MFKSLSVMVVAVLLMGSSWAFAADTNGKGKPTCEEGCHSKRDNQTKKDGNTRKSDPAYDICKAKCDKKADHGK